MIDREKLKQILANMDAAADHAMKEFETLPDDTKQIFANWIRKWYLRAGYKRLGRYLVTYALSYPQATIKFPLRQEKSGELRNAINSFKRKHGHDPIVAERAEVLGGSEEPICERRRRVQPKKDVTGKFEVLSIDKLYEHLDKDIPYDDIDDADNSTEEFSFEHDKNITSPSVEKHHILDERKKILEWALHQLETREREVIERSYGLGDHNQLSLKEIGQLMNVSRERIRQIRNNGVRKLKMLVRKKYDRQVNTHSFSTGIDGVLKTTDLYAMKGGHMVYNQELTQKVLKLEQIYLDPNNPRFSEESRTRVPESRIIEDAVQEEPLNILIRQFDVESLENSIEKNGFLKIHRIVVREIPGHVDSYVVVEGNRRIAACRVLMRKHTAAEKTLADDVKDSIGQIDALVYGGTDTSIAWDIQGITHLIGIKAWSPYNQAYHLVQKMTEEDLGLSDVAKSFGMSSVVAGRMIRAYYGLKQLKEDEEYGSRARNDHYSYFEEAIKKPDVKKWLEWDEQQRCFANEVRRKKFYSLFLPDEGDAKQLAMAIGVRKLPSIIDNPEVLEKFVNGEASLEEALNLAGAASRMPSLDIGATLKNLEKAKSMINGISVGLLHKHSKQIKKVLELIIATAQNVIDKCE